MVVKTKDGSTYMLSTKDGKLYLINGRKQYIVDKISLGIGFPLEISCRELNSITDKIQPDTIMIKSSPIVEII